MTKKQRVFHGLQASLNLIELVRSASKKGMFQINNIDLEGEKFTQDQYFDLAKEAVNMALTTLLQSGGESAQITTAIKKDESDDKLSFRTRIDPL